MYTKDMNSAGPTKKRRIKRIDELGEFYCSTFGICQNKGATEIAKSILYLSRIYCD